METDKDDYDSSLSSIWYNFQEFHLPPGFHAIFQSSPTLKKTWNIQNHPSGGVILLGVGLDTSRVIQHSHRRLLQAIGQGPWGRHHAPAGDDALASCAVGGVVGTGQTGGADALGDGHRSIQLNQREVAIRLNLEKNEGAMAL